VPSPVGHALGGIAAGVWAAPRRDRAAVWGLAALGAAADLDLMAGVHRGVAHSLGAAAIVGVIVWIGTGRWRWGAAGTLAWASHILLDWMGADTSAPVGIEALWPFSGRFVRSPFVVFPSVSRQYWRAGFWHDTATAVLVEIVILLPLAAAVIYASGARPFRSCPPPGGAPRRG
jgi:inner membrane protein